jgi:TetR/AcrR family transcriptional regulator, transcriptional repressor for nem operon
MSNTKEFIIDEAYNLFLSHSYEAVSISVISQAIGFTKGAIYHHFKNKEELFFSVIDKYLQFEGLIAEVETITFEQCNDICIENVRKILTKMFGRFPEFVGINYVSLVADAFRHYPDFARRMDAFFSDETVKTKKVIDHCVKRGEIRNDVDTSVLANNYISTTIGLAGNLVQNKTVDEIVESLKSQLQALYMLLKV